MPDTHLSPEQSKQLRSQKRRRRNRLALAISLGLIFLYSLDLGVDQRANNISRPVSSLTVNQHLVQAASDLTIQFFNKDGQHDITLHADKANFGSPQAMNLPEQLTQQILADSTNDDAIAENDLISDTISTDETIINDTMTDDIINDELFASATVDEISLLNDTLPSIPTHDNKNHNILSQLLLQPVTLISHKKNKPSTTLTANYAFIDKQGHMLHFNNDVRIENTPADSWLSTDNLSLNTLDNQIYGSQPVTLKLGNTLTHALGIEGSQLEGKWRLLSSVKTSIAIQ